MFSTLLSETMRNFWRVILVALLSGSPAWPASSMSKAIAQKNFKNAQHAYDLGRFEEALSQFTQVYESTLLPGLLFNIAQCHRQLNHHGQALFFYRRFLAISPHPPKNQKLVESLIAEMDVAQKKSVHPDTEKARPLPLPLPPEISLNPRGKIGVAARPAFTPPQASPDSASGHLENSAPLTQKWWFWAGIGVVAGGAAAGVYALVPTHPKATLGDIRP